MDFWIFLSIFFSGRILLKAYKYYSFNQTQNRSYKDDLIKLENKIFELEKSIKEQNINKRLAILEENVFFGEFELNKKFEHLKKEIDQI